MELDDDREPGSGSLWAANDPTAVVRRVWYALPAVGALMVAVTAVAFEWRDVVGVTVGVGFAAFNFWFLNSSIRSILGAGHERAPSGTSLMFVARWAIVGMVGYLIYETGWASGGGILTGLLALGGAALVEAAYQLWCAFAHADDSAGDQPE